MNYQYRHGTPFSTATKTLYEDGGFGRYYQGLAAALVQGVYANIIYRCPDGTNDRQAR